ncbi:AAA family ATPase [Azovibrio restrictus]|uniref:MinD/ParA family ATP-binding protein n=1 Tax=Azovibrio restrictus TaxID=146938 RepID=UPI0026EF1EED|nr:AAA family ATPase [Azovibrio restrictus]MDD3481916.1 AAA family ATPase [Azovibrio restrictus]
MADFRHDQAAGLRRMFNRRQLRVVTFTSGSPGVGKTSVVANVAVALARLGLEVLVVDENGGAGHMGTFFGIHPQGDLLQVLNRQRPLEQVLFTPVPGVNVLPAGMAARQLGRLSPAQQQAMLAGMASLERPVDVILVDTSPNHAHGFSPWGLAAGEAVMVVSGSGSSITDSYALIKKVSLAFARRHFRILVNRVKTREDGLTIFGNLRKVAAQRGIAQLEYGGAVPLDDSLKQVAQFCQPIVSTLPDAPAAEALREFAADMLDWPSAEYENGGVEQFIQQLLHLSHRITPRVLQA